MVFLCAPFMLPDRIDWALADFGEPKYGGLMQGKLVYPTEDETYAVASLSGARPACPLRDTPAQFACLPFVDCKWQMHPEPGTRRIMLVDRGPDDSPCYFITKVLNAQGAGADAVIVVNSMDGAELTTAVTPDEEKFAELAAGINISAGLISYEDGGILKGLLKQGKHVTVVLNWTNTIPRAKHVIWEFWTNTNDECGGSAATHAS